MFGGVGAPTGPNQSPPPAWAHGLLPQYVSLPQKGEGVERIFPGVPPPLLQGVREGGGGLGSWVDALLSVVG